MRSVLVHVVSAGGKVNFVKNPFANSIRRPGKLTTLLRLFFCDMTDNFFSSVLVPENLCAAGEFDAQDSSAADIRAPEFLLEEVKGILPSRLINLFLKRNLRLLCIAVSA
jgi:hypothetical protein